MSLCRAVEGMHLLFHLTAVIDARDCETHFVTDERAYLTACFLFQSFPSLCDRGHSLINR
jgi:hypothetical protein